MSAGEAPGPSGKVLGRVVFEEGGRAVEATLHGDGRWTCAASPGVADALNADAQAGDGGDDGGDARGRDALIRAARRLGGMAWLGPQE